MAFIDELTFHISAGRGGDGIVSWRHEKGRDMAGPDGGNGGAGGDVYLRTVRNIGLLYKYRTTKEFEADSGEKAMSLSKHGAKGKDLIIDLPLGSVVTNLATGKKIELLKEGEELFFLKGGNGGYGNEHFKGSTNRRPKEWTPGKEGEAGNFYVELELVVDAGFVGLPNAGKSSLLNVLTNADAKVGSYQFTTLEPNLGDFHGYILADIPGLIEGASDGKGLGYKFLRHIKRTKILFHCISLENENISEAYEIVRHEMLKSHPSLAEKKEIIILTKTDLIKPELLEKKKKEIKGGHEVFTVSVYDENSIKALGVILSKVLSYP